MKVIIFCADSVRPDHMQIYGYNRKNTPFLCSQKVQKFTNCRSYSTWTPPSVFYLLSGQEPPMFDGIPKEIPAAPALSERFHDSFALTMLEILHPQWGWGQFFNSIAVVPKWSVAKIPGGLTDDSLAAIAYGFDSKAGGNYLMYFHLGFTHVPYEGNGFQFPSFSPEVKPVFTGAFSTRMNQLHHIPQTALPMAFKEYTAFDYETMLASYDAAIQRTDALIQNICARIPDAIYIYTSDHGELLWEHGFHFCHFNLDGNHQFDLWNEHRESLRDILTQVPLLVWSGTSFPGEGIDAGIMVDEVDHHIIWDLIDAWGEQWVEN